MLVLGPWQDGLFGGVIVINALIGITQELRAKWALDGLAVLNQTKAQVIRSVHQIDIASSDRRRLIETVADVHLVGSKRAVKAVWVCSLTGRPDERVVYCSLSIR